MKVEYEGGSIPTLIGDEEVENQLRYSEQFGQVEGDPTKNGYFLYDFGICRNCYNSLITSDHKKYSAITMNHRAEIQIAKQKCYQLMLNEVYSAIPSVINQVTYGTILSITNEEVHEEDEHAIKSEKRTKKRVNSYWHKYKDKLVTFYVELLIAVYVNRTLVNYVNDASSLLDSYSKKVVNLPFFNSILIEKNVCEPENLYNYIVCNESTRFPVPETPNALFYNQISYGLFDLYEDSKIDYDEIVTNCSRSIEIINSVKGPVMQVLRKEAMSVINKILSFPANN